MGETHPNRTIIRVTGEERESFLQGLVSNNVTGIGALSYAALLTPQGKYIADFFLLPEGDGILIDVQSALAGGLVQKLKMYKLRAKVELEITNKYAIRGTGDRPEGAHDDPRHPALGWRLYSDTPGGDPVIDWDAIRVAHCIPETGVELDGDAYILEAGFDRLHGVDFRKGCYVGQEVTARMKHKTALRKGFVTVSVEGDAAPGTPVLTEDGKEAGRLTTVSGGKAIAYLRFDRATGPMRAGGATVTWTP
ncbi:YgfZ/GcvT domain-containing protein [Sinisalibacter aestuarii]|uniref:Aminomethyltransferase n=1 Tax=Sinisalibacter aestuarii TaxID=2949426 RepID=A0ABQ5LX77_9RHOB|nr:folate-binding protein [Sinisalibacter aestuarii]GKY89529.1 aminomethyltransferase [Sinisalibacter aestuarii]